MLYGFGVLYSGRFNFDYLLYVLGCLLFDLFCCKLVGFGLFCCGLFLGGFVWFGCCLLFVILVCIACLGGFDVWW